MSDQVTLKTSRLGIEELLRLARSKRKALRSLAASPLAGMKRHAAKRTAQAAEWDVIVNDCIAALDDPSSENTLPDETIEVIRREGAGGILDTSYAADVNAVLDDVVAASDEDREDAADLADMERVLADGESPIPWDQAKRDLGVT